MARYRKKKQKRQDYREGGRVGYQTAGMVSYDGQEDEREIAAADEEKFEDEQAFKSQYEQDNPPPNRGGGGAGSAAMQNYNNKYTQAYKDYLASQNNTTTKTTSSGMGQPVTLTDDQKKARDERLTQASDTISKAAKGEFTGPEIPAPKMLGELDPAALVTAATKDKVYAGGEAPRYNPETGMIDQGGITLPLTSMRPEDFAKEQGLNIQDFVGAGPASEVFEMGENVKVDAPTLKEDFKNITPETVTTGTVSTIDAPDKITAPTVTAATVDEDVTIDAAQGELSDEAELTPDEIAAAADVEDVAPIEGADVEIPEGALTDRVTGTISDGAKATAAINAGTTLAKITRAKKELRSAGLTEEQIAEIGNDIEALEARLTDFTEEERGIIAGVDKDILVTSQLNGLLEGMENGQIPPWAAPVVSQVEQMLAARGLSASSVGRDALFSAIITAAMPLAQSNATALQQAATQQRTIEAAESEANAQRQQQTALTNASNVFKMDMAQFSADVQIALSNSKFLQTVAFTEASYDQQAAVQNATIQAQINLAEASNIAKLTSENAKNFLAMDMANLTNEQQAITLANQIENQRVLSNQASENAASQFNAKNQMQVDQFMATLAQQTKQFNSQQINSMETFNANAKNAAEARRVANEVDIAKTDAAMKADIDKFNSTQAFAREQFNTKNAQAVSQADVQNRRRVNTINTAAINAVNQQNAQNAFGLTQQAIAFMGQELRDQADYSFRTYDNYEQRKASLYIAMLGNEGTNYEGGNWQSTLKGVGTLLDGFL